MKHTTTINESHGVIRVDKFLANKFPEYSRAAIVKLFTLKLIKLDGVPIQPGYRLKPGAKLEYDLAPLKQKPEVIKLPIIYEDDNILVIDKPVGIISHARGKFWQEASVASFVRHHTTKNKKGIDFDEKDYRAGIVHRLDRATSGVMLCAKNQETLSFIQQQFSNRTVDKSYIAIVKGVLKPTQALIDAPIARNPKDPKRFCIDKSGKEAQTEYRTLSSNDRYCKLLLHPKTGRTHQLRIHLEYIGHPIVGDELYRGEEYKRLMLHAFELKVKIPGGKYKAFTAPLPEEFTEFINE